MNTIKKIDIKKMMNGISRNYIEGLKENKGQNVEIMNVENQTPRDYYLSKDTEETLLNEKPTNKEELEKKISTIKNSNLDIGRQLSITAMLVALPNVVMVDTEGWDKVFEPQHEPGTEAYNLLHNYTEKIIKSDGKPAGEYGYGSCTHAVATIVKPIYDPDFPTESSTVQEEYLKSHPEKWQSIAVINNGEKWSQIKPGDIAISELKDNKQHIMMCTGFKNGNPLFYEGAAIEDDFSMYPIISQKEKNDDRIQRKYMIYRPVNDNN